MQVYTYTVYFIKCFVLALVCFLLIYFELKDHNHKYLQTCSNLQMLRSLGKGQKKSEMHQSLLSNFIILMPWKDKTGRIYWNLISSEGRNWKQHVC